jgi:hypothetical protein
MEGSTLRVFVGYMESHPLVAAALGIVAVVLVLSVLRRLVKLAFILAVVILIGFYWTNREAQADWRLKAEALGRRAAAIGQGAVKVGKKLLDDGKADGEHRAAKDEGKQTK